jgi:hypothetical protein
VYLKSEGIKINKSYIERFKINIENDIIILYKKVSKDFKTQEYTANETIWLPGTKVEHNNWNPTNNECGEGKFHACAKPYWCDIFRNNKDDRYISIKVNINDIYEWKDNPSFPFKIGFRKALEIKEVDRFGNEIKLKNKHKIKSDGKKY